MVFFYPLKKKSYLKTRWLGTFLRKVKLKIALTCFPFLPSIRGQGEHFSLYPKFLVDIMRKKKLKSTVNGISIFRTNNRQLDGYFFFIITVQNVLNSCSRMFVREWAKKLGVFWVSRLSTLKAALVLSTTFLQLTTVQILSKLVLLLCTWQPISIIFLRKKTWFKAKISLVTPNWGR